MDHGEGKIIDLVRYQKERKLLKKTGTDDDDLLQRKTDNL